jgi:5'-nucleotidase
MHLLITNDDGVDAPGLLALTQALRNDFQLSILAPDRNWSACGHVKTLNRPLSVRETKLLDGTPALASDGAPSDCVALALLGLIDKPVDLVVSGINPLANLGQDLTYSGTVMAAMEAAIFGIPGIALSLNQSSPEGDLKNFEPAAQVGASIIKQIITMHISERIFFNINIPDLSREKIRGVAITRQGTRVYRDALEKRPDPNGQTSYWIAGEAPTGVMEPETDFWALAHDYVSITPLGLDLTDRDTIPKIKAWRLKTS